MNTNNAIEDLRHRAAIYQQAAEYIAENFDEDEDVDIEEVVRDIERGNAERFAELEERSMQNAWQQDIIDMYRRER